jgi:hypothetical protein
MEGRKKSLNQDIQYYGITRISNFPALAFFLTGGRLTLSAKNQELRAISNQSIMVSRPHPETNENRHKRFAQHIGTPRRGAPGRRRQIKNAHTTAG